MVVTDHVGRPLLSSLLLLLLSWQTVELLVLGASRHELKLTMVQMASVALLSRRSVVAPGFFLRARVHHLTILLLLFGGSIVLLLVGDRDKNRSEIVPRVELPKGVHRHRPVLVLDLTR